VSRELASRLRDALTAADYTYDRVAELLGSRAHAALERNETTPALRRTADGSPLATLTRLFLLQAAVPLEAARRAFGAPFEALVGAGLLTASADEVAAALDVRPYATDETHLWIVSDLTPGLDGHPVRVAADHVLGISPAATSLAQLTIREPCGTALDLGCGCGVQALHLAAHAQRVIATDVNDRALAITRFNAALNGVTNIEVRAGSLFEPVRDVEFGLVVTNPPFVISPATEERLVYRDSGLPGDAVVEQIVRTAPDHLAPGGWLQVLANWSIRRNMPWDERLTAWTDERTAALVVQREVLDPAEYVELWLKDAGVHGRDDYPQRYDAWLRWLDDEGIEGIGFGWINLLAEGAGQLPPDTYLDWPYAVEQPIAPAIADWATAGMLAREVGPDDRLTCRVDVIQETTGAPGAADPETIVLRQQRGFRRARQADTVEAALVGACDGELSVGEILDAIAMLTESDPTQLRASYLPVVHSLVGEGFLVQDGR